MKPFATRACIAAAVLAVAAPSLAASVPASADPSPSGGAVLRHSDQPQHQFTVETQSLRGLTFVCDDLTLRVTRGRSTETTDADLRGGVARISISRVAPHLRLHGSDGRTYRATGFTVAWFVLKDPDFETPVHGLEVTQVMFRGGPGKSPGWLRERIAWADKQETESVRGPCAFAD